MATANTFEQIGSTVTVGAGSASSIEFTSIPATYTDLVIVGSLKGVGTGGGMSAGLVFNTAAADSAYKGMYGGGGTASAPAPFGDTAKTDIYFGEVINISSLSYFSNHIIYIPNYTVATSKTSVIQSVTENNHVSTGIANFMSVGLCTKTAAITTITLRPFGGTGDNFKEYSTASLYGILKY